MISTDKEAGSSRTSVSLDPRRELVDRVVASPIFAKSERLSSLLTYICDIALSGREAEISEQTIGAALFGRSPDYDSSIDGIVRTQASRLRQKLDLYFDGEGAEETVRIVIPKGGYVPFFVPRASRETVAYSPPSLPVAATAVALENPAEQGLGETQIQVEMRPRKSATLAWALAALFAMAVLLLFFHDRREIAGIHLANAPHPFWSRMFAESQRTLIVPGDSGLVMLQGITTRNIDLAEYLSGDHQRKSPMGATAVMTEADDFGGRRYTSIVDLEIVHALDQISIRERGKPELRYARDLRPDDLKSGDVILIGATEANPWVELFERNMNFVFFHDRPRRVMSVLNRSPKGDEPRQWDSGFADSQRRVYGVVAYLPNLNGNGNALLIEGTSMAGTDSAWDFVSDDAQLLPFLKRIQRADGSFPHFEVVLGTNNFSGSAAKTDILAWRTGN